MPVKKIDSKRGKPLFFFRGTEDGIKNMGDWRTPDKLEGNFRELARYFKRNGVIFRQNRELKYEDSIASLGNFRERVLQTVRELKRSGKGGNAIVPFLFNDHHSIEPPHGYNKIIEFGVKVTRAGTVYIYQNPVVHGITSYNIPLREDRGDPFISLKKIMHSGFTGHTAPNIYSVGLGRRKMPNPDAAISTLKETFGDAYTLELMPVQETWVYRGRFVPKAPPKQILRITIRLNRDLTEEEIRDRKDFYLREIHEKFRVPLTFVKEAK